MIAHLIMYEISALWLVTCAAYLYPKPGLKWRSVSPLKLVMACLLLSVGWNMQCRDITADINCTVTVTFS